MFKFLRILTILVIEGRELHSLLQFPTLKATNEMNDVYCWVGEDLNNYHLQQRQKEERIITKVKQLEELTKRRETSYMYFERTSTLLIEYSVKRSRFLILLFFTSSLTSTSVFLLSVSSPFHRSLAQNCISENSPSSIYSTFSFVRYGVRHINKVSNEFSTSFLRRLMNRNVFFFSLSPFISAFSSSLHRLLDSFFTFSIVLLLFLLLFICYYYRHVYPLGFMVENNFSIST